MTSFTILYAFHTPLSVSLKPHRTRDLHISSKSQCRVLTANQSRKRSLHTVPNLSLNNAQQPQVETSSNRDAIQSDHQQNFVSSVPNDVRVRPVRDTHPVVHIASARAITPFRRRREDASHFTEEPSLPSQRRSDLMAPKKTGVWALIPYVAATAVIMGITWLGRKRFVARQERLVDEFGEVMVIYGTSPGAKREIASEYKRKLGPGLRRGAMFASYLKSLVSEKPIVPSSIQDVSIVKRLLKLSEDRAVNAINALGTELQDSPSLLGKLLFLSDRIIAPDKLSKLSLVSRFPYSPSTVSDLQRNMLERCFKEYVNDEIDVNGIEEPPMAAAAALRLNTIEAQSLFDAVILTRQRRKQAEEAELAAAAAEEGSKPNIGELDYPARSGEPAKANVHAYQCSDCGYTLFPAAGREFKFYGDDFVCPACGAPKDKFIDLNSEE